MKHSIFIITSYILLLVPCFSTTLPPLEEQNKLVKVIENTSWRGLKIANPPTEEFIEKKLLAKFSSLPQRFPKADFGSLIHKKDDIIQHLKIEGSPAQTQVAHYLIGAINKDYFTLSSATKMLNFQYMVQTIPDPLKTSFWATKDYGENISMEDSFITTNPRTQQRILNKRDLLVFKEKVEAYHSLNADTPIISHKNFEVDDVIKAASLCGTFCEVDEDDELLPNFSGMLVPGQPYSSQTFSVHTCLHGFVNEKIKNIYFVPYGLALRKKNAFQVEKICLDHDGNTELTQEELDDVSGLYGQRDYILAIIKSTTLEGEVILYDTLQRRQKNNVLGEEDFFEGFPTASECLPQFSGQSKIFDNDFQDFSLNSMNQRKVFVIGRPGYNLAALNDTGFVIVHNLTDNIEEHPHRSLKDDPDTLYYDPDEGNVSCIPGEVAIDFPSTSGMSGGICLQVISCMETDGRTIRIARPYAVVWGSERIFEVSKDSYKKIINLKSLVSKIVV